MNKNPPQAADPDFPSLADHFLISMPTMVDPNFSGTVVYICEHSSKGALGLVVNKPSDISISTLFAKVELELIDLSVGEAPVLIGGPVQNDRGFVLHTPQDRWDSSLVINESMALTTSKDVLEAISNGCGPERWLITLGYSGWSAGQLDDEIAHNGWLTVPARESILFDTPVDQRFDAAFKLLGFDPWMLSADAGRA